MTSPSNSWPRQLDIDLYLAENPATEWQAHDGGGTANSEKHPLTYATHTTSAQHSAAPAQSAAGGSADAGVNYSDLSWVNPFVFGQSVGAGVKEGAHAPKQSHTASHSTMCNIPSTSLQPSATLSQSINQAPLFPSSAQTLPQSFAAPSQADHAPPPDFLFDTGPPMTEEETDALFRSLSSVWPAPNVDTTAPAVNQIAGYATPAPQALYDRTIDTQQGVYTGQLSSTPNMKTQVPNSLKNSASAYPPRTFEEPRQHRIGPLTDASNTFSNPAQKVFGWPPPQANTPTAADQNAGLTAPSSNMMYGQNARAQQAVLATVQPNASKASAQMFNAQQASASAYQQRAFEEPRPHVVDPLTDAGDAVPAPASKGFAWPPSPYDTAVMRGQVDEVLRRKVQAPGTRQSAVRTLSSDVGNGIGQNATLSRSTPALPRSLTFPPPSAGGFGSTSTSGLAFNSTAGLTNNFSTILAPASNLEVIDETPEIVARATKRKADFRQEGHGAVKQVRFRSPDRDEQAKPEEVGAPEAVNAPAVTRSRNVSTHTENHSTFRMTPLPGPLTTSTTASAAPHWTDSARRDGAWIIHLPRGMVFASYPTHPLDLYLIPASDARQLGCKILQLGQVLTAPQMDLPHPVEQPERGGAVDARYKPVAEAQIKPAAVAPTSTTATAKSSEAASAIRPARQRSASLSSLSSLSSDEDSATARPNGVPDKEHRYCPWQTSPGARCGYDYWTDGSLAQDLSFRVALTRHTYPHRSAALGEACPEYLKLKGPRAIDLSHVKVRCGMWEEGAPAACGASVCYGDLIDHIIDVHYNAGQTAQ
ncbi:hypothetical protein GGF50DRAFT_62494 [Schizophyllum commune]